jgi:hypothetical protein
LTPPAASHGTRCAKERQQVIDGKCYLYRMIRIKGNPNFETHARKKTIQPIIRLDKTLFRQFPVLTVLPKLRKISLICLTWTLKKFPSPQTWVLFYSGHPVEIACITM